LRRVVILLVHVILLFAAGFACRLGIRSGWLIR